MRRSLFDNYTQNLSQEPRLRANIFARIAKFSFNNPALIFAFWFLLTGILAAYSLSQKSEIQRPLELVGDSSAQKYQSILQKNFASLNSIVTINISNADSERLKRARQTLVAGLEADQTNFDLVYAPGTGAYYDTNAVLYYSLNDIKTRVAYARSLKPLFEAIAEEPSTASLATLVNEVLASIELGRDPQGLDELFSESAKAVQALMLGTERPVDWNFVAGLNAENTATNALIFAVPKKDARDQAALALKNLLGTLPQDDGTTILLDQAQEPKIDLDAVPIAKNLIIAGMAMAGVLCIVITLGLLGDVALTFMALAPAAIAAMLCYFMMALVLPANVNAVLSVIFLAPLIAVQVSGRFIFALIDTHNIARTKESAVMLASQKQGFVMLWMSFSAAAILLCLLAMNDVFFILPSMVVAIILLITTFASITISSATASFQKEAAVWRAKEWLQPIADALFKKSLLQLLLKSVAVAAVLASALGFWFAPSMFSSFEKVQPVETAVNIIATSTDEAERIVASLKSIPEAQGVRWLGAFLPQQVDEKQEILRELKDLFPRVTPQVPQDVDLLREHIAALQESLKTIANSNATRPELKAAAQEFRQSLELLAATSDNKEVLAFENRIFGTFNVLADRSQVLADMEKPNFNSFDDRLRRLFLSDEGIFRLEVTPLNGTSNEDLARKLNAERFHVAHPILAVDDAGKAQVRAFTYVLGAAFVIAVFAVFALSRSFAQIFIFAFALLSFVGVQLAYLQWSSIAPNLNNLLILLCGYAFVTLGFLAHAAQPKRHEKSIETLLPIALLAMACLPFSLLKATAILPSLGQLTLTLATGLIILEAFYALSHPAEFAKLTV
jgi:uncharacterized protein